MNEIAKIDETNKRPTFEPGWYSDIPNEDYHRSLGYGSTTLKKLNEMPLSKLEYQQRHPKPSSPAMNLGTAVHTMALEPHMVEDEIAIMPVLNLRTNAGKAEKAEFIANNKGKLILDENQFEIAQAMAKNLREHPQVGLYLDQKLEGKAEQSVYYWYNPEDWDQNSDYRIMCKVRPDYIVPGHPIVFDLKTTRDASFSEFAKSCKNLSYHMSAAMYLDGCNRHKDFKEAMGVQRFEQFVWICVENEPPYEVASYSISNDDLEDGRMLYHSAVRKLHEYKKSNWKGYGEFDGRDFQPITRILEIPKWGNKIV